MSYIIEDIEYASVTEALSAYQEVAGYKYWASRCNSDYILGWEKTQKRVGKKALRKQLALSIKAYQEESRKAMDIGLGLHKILESHIKGDRTGLKTSSDFEKIQYKNFLKWEHENVKAWIGSEIVVRSQIYNYAGTVDAVAELKDGNTWVLDFKTGNKTRPDYYKQLAAYRWALAEGKNNLMQTAIIKRSDRTYTASFLEERIKTNRLGILQFTKDTMELKLKDVTEKEPRAFNSFLRLLDFYYADKERQLKNNPRVKEAI